MLRFLVRLALNAIALLIIARVVPGISVEPVPAVIAALVLGALNAVMRPVLILLTLPVTILTLGLFLFVVNAALFGLAAWLVPGFAVRGFGAALVGSILYTIAGWITGHLLRDDHKRIHTQTRVTYISR
ncbi:MAG TPA: phage holin family protein [Chloroflexota bacterium]|nr:phage holin family protein [Chloroflexota bacterium]